MLRKEYIRLNIEITNLPYNNSSRYTAIYN